MRLRIWWCTVLTVLAAGCLLTAAEPANISALRQAFEHPPDDARMMVRWWWFGPAVVKPELEREMRAMKQGGIGGFEVQPTYPLELDHNFPYLSDEFLSDLKFTAEKAKEIGLRFQLTLGSGWPFGGPHIPITEASARLRIGRVPIPAGATSLPLPESTKARSSSPPSSITSSSPWTARRSACPPARMAVYFSSSAAARTRP